MKHSFFIDQNTNAKFFDPFPNRKKNENQGEAKSSLNSHKINLYESREGKQSTSKMDLENPFNPGLYQESFNLNENMFDDRNSVDRQSYQMLNNTMRQFSNSFALNSLNQTLKPSFAALQSNSKNLFRLVQSKSMNIFNDVQPVELNQPTRHKFFEPSRSQLDNKFFNIKTETIKFGNTMEKINEFELTKVLNPESQNSKNELEKHSIFKTNKKIFKKRNKNNLIKTLSFLVFHFIKQKSLLSKEKEVPTIFNTKAKSIAKKKSKPQEPPSLIKTPQILEYLVKNVSGISKYNLKKRLYDILNTFESLEIIEKVYSKKNNRAYRLLENNEFLRLNEQIDPSQEPKSSKMAEYLETMNKKKLLRARCQLKTNIKKNLIQKINFYRFQINKNKHLEQFKLKKHDTEGKASSVQSEQEAKTKIGLPFVALELIDQQPLDVKKSKLKSKGNFFVCFGDISNERKFEGK